MKVLCFFIFVFLYLKPSREKYTNILQPNQAITDRVLFPVSGVSYSSNTLKNENWSNRFPAKGQQKDQSVVCMTSPPSSSTTLLNQPMQLEKAAQTLGKVLESDGQYPDLADLLKGTTETDAGPICIRIKNIPTLQFRLDVREIHETGKCDRAGVCKGLRPSFASAACRPAWKWVSVWSPPHAFTRVSLSRRARVRDWTCW